MENINEITRTVQLYSMWANYSLLAVPFSIMLALILSMFGKKAKQFGGLIVLLSIISLCTSVFLHVRYWKNIENEEKFVVQYRDYDIIVMEKKTWDACQAKCKPLRDEIKTKQNQVEAFEKETLDSGVSVSSM